MSKSCCVVALAMVFISAAAVSAEFKDGDLERMSLEASIPNRNREEIMEESKRTVPLPNRLEKAKKGEWALYFVPGGTSKYTITDIVEKDGDRLFTIMKETELTPEAMARFEETGLGPKPGVETRELLFNDFVKERESIREKPNTVAIWKWQETLFDKEIDVTCVEMSLDEKAVFSVISDTVPVFGLLRTVTDGFPLIELKEYGE